MNSAEVAQEGPEAVLLRSDIFKFAGVYTFPAKLLSSLYLRVDSAEVAQGGPEAVLLGSDIFKFEDVHYSTLPSTLIFPPNYCPEIPAWGQCRGCAGWTRSRPAGVRHI